MIPEPPSQGQPWTAARDEAAEVPRHRDGHPLRARRGRPAGVRYRQVEIGDGSIVKAHGFVLPERADAPGRFVVCWDGLVYPALSVGDPADLDRDIKDLAAHLKRTREAGKANRFDQGASWGFSREGQQFLDMAAVDDRLADQALPAAPARPCRPGRAPLCRRDDLDAEPRAAT